MKFSKVREVKSPCRAHDTDAGIDFFIPEDFVSTKMKVGDSVLIPSGIKVNVPKGYMLTAFNKSGVATKKGLSVGACVVDESEIETNKGFIKVKYLTKEYCDNNNILLKSFNEITKEYEFKKCDGFRKTNTSECLKIILDNDEELICSKDHKLYINNTWIEAKDIKI